MSACTEDADCPSVQLCYQNTSATWLNGVSRCICNTEYGWVGADCQEFGPATYYLVSSAFLYGFTVLATLLFGLFMVVQLVRNDRFKPSGLTFTLLLVIIQSSMLFARAITVLELLFTPEGQVVTVKIQGELTTKGHQLIIPLRVIISLGVVFSVLVALHVSLLWVQIAQASHKLSSAKKDVLKGYPKIIFGMEGVVVLAVIILGALDLFGLVALALLPVILGLLGLYTYGMSQLKPLLQTQIDSGGGGNKLQTTLGYIQSCYCQTLVAFAFIIAGAVALAVLSIMGYKEVNPEGGISVFNVFNEIVVYGLCILNVTITVYVFRFLRTDMNFSRSGSSKNRTDSKLTTTNVNEARTQTERAPSI